MASGSQTYSQLWQKTTHSKGLATMTLSVSSVKTPCLHDVVQRPHPLHLLKSTTGYHGTSVRGMPRCLVSAMLSSALHCWFDGSLCTYSPAQRTSVAVAPSRSGGNQRCIVRRMALGGKVIALCGHKRAQTSQPTTQFSG